jgi:hypothetical protein
MPVSETQTVMEIVQDNRDIALPQEWLEQLGFEWFWEYTQLTLVDDKIAVHKPTAPGVKYERACKIGDGSYIRRLNFNKIRPPDVLTRPLGIAVGDKVDLSLEENCVAIRKHTETDTVQEIKPEPEFAFCCICGRILYTQWMKKILTKYVCDDCAALVKSQWPD